METGYNRAYTILLIVFYCIYLHRLWVLDTLYPGWLVITFTRTDYPPLYVCLNAFALLLSSTFSFILAGISPISSWETFTAVRFRGSLTQNVHRTL